MHSRLERKHKTKLEYEDQIEISSLEQLVKEFSELKLLTPLLAVSNEQEFSNNFLRLRMTMEEQKHILQKFNTLYVSIVKKSQKFNIKAFYNLPAHIQNVMGRIDDYLKEINSGSSCQDLFVFYKVIHNEIDKLKNILIPEIQSHAQQDLQSLITHLKLKAYQQDEKTSLSNKNENLDLQYNVSLNNRTTQKVSLDKTHTGRWFNNLNLTLWNRNSGEKERLIPDIENQISYGSDIPETTYAKFSSEAHYYPHNRTMIDLPTETLLQVLSYLDYQSLVRVSNVCKTLNSLARQNSLWKHLAISHFPQYKKKILQNTEDKTLWKLFRNQLWSQKDVKNKKIRLVTNIEKEETECGTCISTWTSVCYCGCIIVLIPVYLPIVGIKVERGPLLYIPFILASLIIIGAICHGLLKIGEACYKQGKNTLQNTLINQENKKTQKEYSETFEMDNWLANPHCSNGN